VKAIYQLLRSEQPDIVHLNSTKAGMAGRAAACIARIPCVYTAHGWAFTDGAPRVRAAVAKWAERLAAPFARKIICVSDYDRQLAITRKVGCVSQLVVIRNGVPDVIPALLAHPVRVSDPVFVMVARFAPQKNYSLLLHSLAECRTVFRLQCAGDGSDLDRMRLLARALHLEDRVQFLGMTVDVPRLLQQADGLVLASNWEGLPLCVIEAMRAGLPVIASDVGGVSEAVVDHDTGFLVPRDSQAVLTQSLDRLAAAPGLRVAMGRRGRQRFLEHFTAARMASETAKVYSDALCGAGVATQPQ
jgi:glycosyltransferase involved in cell wall biosynthesis